MDRVILSLFYALLISGDVWVQAAGVEPAHVLRIATLAPARSPRGREYQTFRRELAERTNGQVSVRMYAGGIAVQAIAEEP